MQLSCFITEYMEIILAEWDAFARSQHPASNTMSGEALRNHARQILQAIANDIQTEQSAAQEMQKSRGEARDEHDSAASSHGTIRHNDGFTMTQMIAEYRALRASVLRMWLPHVSEINEDTTRDMLRFNEAIDQAVAESTTRFTEQTNHTRETFLAILGHDLRMPLAAMTMGGDLLMLGDISRRRTAELGSQVKRSAGCMIAMVRDMLEYARTQLGTGMPLTRNQTDVGEICRAAVEEVRTAHANCPIELETVGDLGGSFDAARLQQAISNLLINAVQYRSKEHPVKASVSRESETIVIHVQNRGPIIPEASLQAIFNPLVQLTGDGQQEGRPATSLGLGLFIAREVTQAHQGTITAQSSEESGTVFTIRLPKM